MRTRYLLVIDQGTSSTRAVLFDPDLVPRGSSRRVLQQHFPKTGWVEHDPEEIWSSTLEVCREVLLDAGVDASAVTAVGIANQRETTLLWERSTGRPIYNAIVWQDRRTADYCAAIATPEIEELIKNRTGLLIDPYFSATKVRWLLENVPGALEKAQRGDLAFGTVDTFLIWRLTRGKAHVTDATNASRTMLFDIHQQRWNERILQTLDIPRCLLPHVNDSAADFGVIDAAILGAQIPICGVAGDQQAALVGQGCLTPGSAKCTFGTGSFLVSNTGVTPATSSNRLLTTIAYRLTGVVTYALEASVFVAGSALQWLRDGLKIIDEVQASEAIALRCGVVEDVYFVPAFSGLGAPHWEPRARGAIFGLTRGVGADELVTATLQAVAFQCRDLMEAMAADGAAITSLRTDGGMAANSWFAQFLADMLDIPVQRPSYVESTAVGAACLAGVSSGVFRSLEQALEHLQRPSQFRPAMRADVRSRLYAGWLKAVAQVRAH